MRRVLVLAFLVSLLTGCTRGAPAPTPPAPGPRVSLQATFEHTGNALVVDYQFANDGSVPVVVFNGVPTKETTSTPKTDPNAVYVTASADGTVDLAKRLFPVPAGVDPAARFLMRGSIVAAGARLHERVIVPLPPLARQPYAGASGPRGAALPSPVRRVRFCLGTARQDAVRPVPSSSGDPDPAPIYPHAAGVEAYQSVVCSPPYDLG
jgi:hypothetical protein